MGDRVIGLVKEKKKRWVGGWVGGWERRTSMSKPGETRTAPSMCESSPCSPRYLFGVGGWVGGWVGE